MSARSIVLLVILTVAALGSWYLAQNNRGDDVDDLPYDAEHRGYYLKTARILGTDADGSLLYEIHGLLSTRVPRRDGSHSRLRRDHGDVERS